MVQDWISLSAGRSVGIECNDNTLEVKGTPWKTRVI